MATREGLTLYYAPLTAQIQVRWVLDTYARTRELLASTLGVELGETTVYLLSPEVHDEALGGSHPEWTQGFSIGSEAYINRAPRVVWDESVTEEERIQWLGEHVQEITEMTTAHELTHVALDSYRLPRWLDEGLAEYIEALIAPEGSATRQLLQRRYRVREAMAQDALPTEAQLSAGDWMALVESDEEFGLLYSVSALIVHLVGEASGNAGLHGLVEARGLEVPLDGFIDTQLREWLATPFPEEAAPLVLCGLNSILATQADITSDWNAMADKTSADYVAFKGRIQQLLDSVEALPTDTLVEKVRSAYAQSLSEWIEATDYYIQGDYDSANFHLTRSNSLAHDARQLMSDAWEEYVVVPCTLIEEQLP